jgi:hypothetical protein
VVSVLIVVVARARIQMILHKPRRKLLWRTGGDRKDDVSVVNL